MKISNNATVPVYTISGASARPLPEWLIQKRKRSLKKDAEFAQRVELLQNFEFEEASQCVRVSEDQDYVMSTGTYKPQIHVHDLNQLSLMFERHTNTLNETFLLLSSDYRKSIHLQVDRTIELHGAGALHYSTRIPRFGRDLVYDRRAAEALIPSVGVSPEGMGEVYRLNLEIGRHMRPYEVDVGGDDVSAAGAGSLQGGIRSGSVNVGACAEDSHGLLAFGTSLGTVEFHDPRSRNRIGTLATPRDAAEGRAGITALQFHRSGLEFAAGDENGLVRLYDLRSPLPLVTKDQGYGFPIKNIIYLNTSTSTRAQTSEPKILTADKRIIKIWDARNGAHWTSVEPEVDLNHVEWCKDSGMLLTANEGRQQHAFFIPQLGPAPRWCSFLDNIVEEMAENPDDPNAFAGTGSVGQVYDDLKFLTLPQLRQLNLDHLVGTTSLLRPYMHGYFVAQKLYEEARLISNPDLWQEQRQKSIQEKIAKERESRIRGNKKVAVKVNRKLAEKILEREEKAERRRAKRVLERGGDDEMVVDGDLTAPAVQESNKPSSGVLDDPRFARLFQDEDFEVDEESHEFQAINPSTNRLPKGLTAVEQEELESRKGSDNDDDDDDDDESEADESESDAAQARKSRAEQHDKNRISTSSYKHSTNKKLQRAQPPQMHVSSSNPHSRRLDSSRDMTFGARVSKLRDRNAPSGTEAGRTTTTVVGEREITFMPEKKQKKKQPVYDGEAQRHDRKRNKARRSASNNVFRGM